MLRYDDRPRCKYSYIASTIGWNGCDQYSVQKLEIFSGRKTIPKRIPKRQSKWDIQRNWQQDEEKHNTIRVGHHYTQTIKNNVNKTCGLIQTTVGKDEPNVVFFLLLLRKL